MGLYDTIQCDYPLPDPRLQDAEFQTKSLNCAMQRYTITADGRLLRHPGGGLFDEPPRLPTLEKDVELPIHGDIEMHESWSPSPVEEWVEYTVRFTHGRVEWIRPWTRPDARPATPEPTALKNDAGHGLPQPDVMGRRLTATEFSAQTPEKLELLDGQMPGDRRMLLLLLTSFGLRRTAALVGWFQEILARGTGRVFSPQDNAHWTEVTRPILEAFFHARFFLEMAVRYADLELPPQTLPSGYAALLCLFNLR